MSRPPSKKADIERAAMELFASQGYAATTIKHIAAKAEVTEGALYRHYASKEEMAQSLFQKELTAIVLRLLMALDAGQTSAQKLKAVIRALYTSYQEDPWPLLFVILNFQNLKGDSVLYEQKNLYDYIIQYTHQLMEHAPGTKRNHELLPTILNGMVVQPIIYHYHDKLPRTPLEYLDEIVDNCSKLMGLA